MKRLLAILLFLALFAGCGGGSGPTGASSTSVEKFAFLGDSITHGRRGINDSVEPGFRVRLLELLASIGRPVEPLEDGIPGSLSRDGVARVEELLAHKPAVLNVLYGTNDAYVGIPPEETISNLEKMVSAGRSAGAVVVLGTLPPACGNEVQAERVRAINSRIRDLTSSLNRSRGEVYLADIAYAFEGRGGCRLVNPANGVHPTEEGYTLIADTIFESIRDEKW